MSNKKQEVAIIAPATVLDGIDLIDQRIAQLKTIQDTPYKTSKKLKSVNGEVDITTETSVDVLITGFSTVLAKAAAKEKAYQELGYTTMPVVKIDGSTISDWKEDIKLRIAIIEQKETLDELNEIKKSYTELMDKEDRKKELDKKLQKWAEKQKAQLGA